MPDKTAKLVLAYPPAVYGKAGTTISLLYKGDANYAVLSNIGSADTALCGWRMIKLKKSSSDPSAWQPFECAKYYIKDCGAWHYRLQPMCGCKRNFGWSESDRP